MTRDEREVEAGTVGYSRRYCHVQLVMAQFRPAAVAADARLGPRLVSWMVALSGAFRSSWRNDRRMRSTAGATDGKSTTTSSAKQSVSTRASPPPDMTSEFLPKERNVRPPIEL